jgi:hypothetical protein
MLRVIISATCLVVASPSVVQQVRIITGDIEYVHGPGGQVLDDEKLRARVERQIQEQRAKC